MLFNNYSYIRLIYKIYSKKKIYPNGNFVITLNFVINSYNFINNLHSRNDHVFLKSNDDVILNNTEA